MARVTERDLNQSLRRLVTLLSGSQPVEHDRFGAYGWVVPMGPGGQLVGYAINITDRGDSDGKKYIVETHSGQQPFGGKLRTAKELFDCLEFAYSVVEHPTRDNFFRLADPLTDLVTR